jgi:hypothetical protein
MSSNPLHPPTPDSFVLPTFLRAFDLDRSGRPLDVLERVGGTAGQRVNLDSGYLDHNKIVLASAKGLGQKIDIAQGIYADLVARYRQGHYQPFEWSFPDFKDGRYDSELAEIRRRYLQQLRTIQSTNSNS